MLNFQEVESIFDRNLAKQVNSRQDLKETLDLLRILPNKDEGSMIELVLQKEQDTHRSFLNAFQNENVIIEEVDE
jgi:hypothetical protein